MSIGKTYSLKRKIIISTLIAIAAILLVFLLFLVFKNNSPIQNSQQNQEPTINSNVKPQEEAYYVNFLSNCVGVVKEVKAGAITIEAGMDKNPISQNSIFSILITSQTKLIRMDMPIGESKVDRDGRAIIELGKPQVPSVEPNLKKTEPNISEIPVGSVVVVIGSGNILKDDPFEAKAIYYNP